jgi:hypothetical protein
MQYLENSALGVRAALYTLVRNTGAPQILAALQLREPSLLEQLNLWSNRLIGDHRLIHLFTDAQNRRNHPIERKFELR